MADTFKLGINSCAYLNTGTYAAPVWDELTDFGDFSVKLTWDWAEVPRRLTRIKQKVKTLAELMVTGKHIVSDLPDTGTTDYSRLLDAVMSDNVVDVLVLTDDKAHNGATGFRFDAQVASGDQDQGPAAVLLDDITFQATVGPNKPKRVKVVGGVPTFLNIAQPEDA